MNRSASVDSPPRLTVDLVLDLSVERGHRVRGNLPVLGSEEDGECELTHSLVGQDTDGRDVGVASPLGLHFDSEPSEDGVTLPDRACTVHERNESRQHVASERSDVEFQVDVADHWFSLKSACRGTSASKSWMLCKIYHKNVKMSIVTLVMPQSHTVAALPLAKR